MKKKQGKPKARSKGTAPTGKRVVANNVKPVKVGAPKDAPAYFFIREFHKNEWKYFDKKGKEVSLEKVKQSKRKVYTRDKEGEIIQRKASVEKKARPEKDTTVLKTSIFAYSVLSKITDSVSKNRKIYFRIFGNTYEVSKGSLPIFSLAFTEIHGEFLILFKPIIDSPVLTIGYIEFKKNSIFDFDDLTFEIAGGDYEGMTEEEFADIDNELDLAPEIKRAMKLFRSFVKRKFKEYFNI